MIPTVLTCPHCGAPLAITRFAATVVCSFCDATVRVDPSSVSANRYKQAWAEWNGGGAAGGARLLSIADTQWVEQSLLARGEISDVYIAKRARFPSELVLLKVLRDAEDAPLLDREWRALNQLQDSSLGSRIPDPVVKSDHACAYRWASGFIHTFESIREAYPDGIPAVAAIWVWRRILEVLAVMRQAGLVHGALLPNHLLIQKGEHGVRIVGFSCADAPNAPLRLVSTQFESFYPASSLKSGKLTSSMDIVMSARCVAYLLGTHAPPPLADLLRRMGTDDDRSDADPWKLRKEVGELGTALFGPPAFHPIEM